MRNRIRLLACACGLHSLLVVGCADPAKSPAEHARDTAALSKVLPALEAKQVTRLRYQEGSRVLDYPRGFFAEVADSDRTPRSSISFDATARSDLEALWESIEATGTGVFLVDEARYDGNGRLEYAEFHCSKGFVSQRYVYEPGYTLPKDLSQERWHTAIDDDWYYRRDDWN